MIEKGKNRVFIRSAKLLPALLCLLFLFISLRGETGRDDTRKFRDTSLIKDTPVVISPWLPANIQIPMAIDRMMIYPVGLFLASSSTQKTDTIKEESNTIRSRGKTILLPDEFIMYQDRS